MIQGLNNNPTALQLFNNNQSYAQNGQYQNIAGPNDVADKTAALALNTVKTINQGLVNALNESIANLNQNVTSNINAGNNGNGNANTQYNGNGRITAGVNQTGNILNKIV